MKELIIVPLAYIAYKDWKYRTVPDSALIGLMLLGLLFLPTLSFIIVLGFVLLHSIGQIGGGDVKLIAILALMLPKELPYIFGFAGVMIIPILLVTKKLKDFPYTLAVCMGAVIYFTFIRLIG